MEAIFKVKQQKYAFNVDDQSYKLDYLTRGKFINDLKKQVAMHFRSKGDYTTLRDINFIEFKPEPNA